MEPSGIWSNYRIMFDDSLSTTQNVIMTNGIRALTALVERIDRLYEALFYFPQLLDYYTHPEIPQILTEICTHQALASQILFNQSEGQSKESARGYQLRLERFNYVYAHCQHFDVSTSVLTNRVLRNQLIHIDEYLEKALRAPNTGWSIDTAIAYRIKADETDGLEVGYCRTFIASEEILLHLKNEISVKDLRREATDVLNKVFGLPVTPHPKRPATSLEKYWEQPINTTGLP